MHPGWILLFSWATLRTCVPAAGLDKRDLAGQEKPMRPVPVGTRGSFSMTVLPEHLANRFKDATLPAVLSTPVMIMAMENAALEALKPYFEAGESAVGSRVDISHLAATPVGRRIVASAEVTGTRGRQIDFSVSATDGSEEIGRGSHARVVIDLAVFAERLAAKVKDQAKPTAG